MTEEMQRLPANTPFADCKWSGVRPAVSSPPGLTNLPSLGTPVGTSALLSGSSLCTPDPLGPAVPSLQRTHSCPQLSTLGISPSHPTLVTTGNLHIPFHPLFSVASEMTRMTTSKADKAGLCCFAAGVGWLKYLTVILFPCKAALAEYDAGHALP